MYGSKNGRCRRPYTYWLVELDHSILSRFCQFFKPLRIQLFGCIDSRRQQQRCQEYVESAHHGESIKKILDKITMTADNATGHRTPDAFDSVRPMWTRKGRTYGWMTYAKTVSWKVRAASARIFRWRIFCDTRRQQLLPMCDVLLSRRSHFIDETTTTNNLGSVTF